MNSDGKFKLPEMNANWSSTVIEIESRQAAFDYRLGFA